MLSQQTAAKQTLCRSQGYSVFRKEFYSSELSARLRSICLFQPSNGGSVIVENKIKNKPGRWLHVMMKWVNSKYLSEMERHEDGNRGNSLRAHASSPSFVSTLIPHMMLTLGFGWPDCQQMCTVWFLIRTSGTAVSSTVNPHTAGRCMKSMKTARTNWKNKGRKAMNYSVQGVQ